MQDTKPTSEQAPKPAITFADIISAVRAFVEANPDAAYKPPKQKKADYAFSTCFYTRGKLGGGKGCIFGQVLMKLGVPKETLVKYDTVGNSFNNGIAEVCEDLNIKLTYEQRNLLSSIQRDQDAHWPLGKILPVGWSDQL